MLTSNRFLVTALFLSIAACSPPPPADSGPVNDVAASDATATDTAMDTGATDVRVATDTRTDVRPDGPTADTGPGFVCGQTVYECVCGCGMDQACANACFSTAAPSCATCLRNAYAVCCPAQSSAVNDCATQAMMDSDAGPACTTQACLQARCSTQLMAYQSCVNTEIMNTPTCTARVDNCLPTTCP